MNLYPFPFKKQINKIDKKKMTTAKDTKYDKMERKFVGVAKDMLDNFGIDLSDLHDILNDNFEDEGEE